MSKIQSTSNFLKHTSKNPLQQLLIKNFYNSLVTLVKPLNPKTVLDAGCGEGFSLHTLIKRKIGKTLEGIDDSKAALATGKTLFPTLVLKYGSVENLPYKDNSFDLVICTEVLEHVKNPSKVFSEILRVAKRYIILSVPHEPFFMGANLLRGKNIERLGNDEGHINHWTFFSFEDFLKRQKIKVNAIHFPFPWIMALVEKK